MIKQTAQQRLLQNRVNLQIGLAQGTSKEYICLVWHTSTGSILKPPPKTPDFYYSGYKFWAVQRGSRKQRARVIHTLGKKHLHSSCSQGSMPEWASLPTTISANITQKWERKQWMWMKEQMTKRPDFSHNNLQRGLETFSLLDYLFINISFYFW